MTPPSISAPRILLFTGDGKGKTTAALGLAFRALGHGMAVAVVQFVKGNADIGEMHLALSLPNLTFIQTGLGFVPPPHSPQYAQHQAAAQAALRRAAEILAAGRHPVIILDEICIAVAKGLLTEAAVIDLLRQAAPQQCLVLTGRGATPRLIALADTVTEMRCIKHALQSGRPAEKGVEL